MGKHESEFSDAVMGADVALVAAQEVQDSIEHFSGRISDYRSDCAELVKRSDHAVPDVAVISDRACAELRAQVEVSKAEIAAKGEAAKLAGRDKRAFQVAHGVTHTPVEVDKPLSMALIGGMTFIEGLVNSTFFYSAGFVPGVAGAAGIGFTVAGATTLLSAGLGGGFFGRYWNYGLKARWQTPDLRKARRMGRIGSLLTGGAIAGVVGLSAMVRASGRPDALAFTPETVSGIATNMYSLMLLATGAAFAILSWRTALSAFGDPYPGYAQACAKSMAAEREAINALTDAHRRLDTIHEDAMDDLTGVADAIERTRTHIDEDFTALEDRYHALIGDIDGDVAAIKSRIIPLLQAQHIILQNERGFDPEAISLDGLKAQISAPVKPAFDDLSAFRRDYKQAVNTLAQAYKDALSALTPADDDQAVPPSQNSNPPV